MKELQEGEAKGENVKGTNLSQEELGLDLVEQRTVFYCNACTRYLPIKGTLEETKSKHCMTLTHLKYVDEYRQREKQIALREKEREKAAAKKALEEASAETSAGAGDTTDGKLGSATDEGKEKGDDTEKAESVATEGETNEKEAENMDTDAPVGKAKNIKQEVDNSVVEDEESDEFVKVVLKNHSKEGNKEPAGDEIASEGQPEEKISEDAPANESLEEDDEDEIELHAGDEVEEDLSMDDSGWSRRTRSSIRKNSTDRKSTS
jgi:hypothetical protein